MKLFFQVLLVIATTIGVFIPSQIRAGAGVVAGEYFWDTDPGQGNGAALSAGTTTFGLEVVRIIQNGVGIPAGSGAHSFNIRTQDTSGAWGPVFSVVVEAQASSGTGPVTKVRAGEYFWDADPGQGNGNPMVAFDGNFGQAVEVIAQSNIALPTPAGAHSLNVRAQDTAGNWGPVFSMVLDVQASAGGVRIVKIRAGEYFWDTDPGQGNGNPMVALDGNFGQAVEDIFKSNATLPTPSGAHTLNIRAQDTVGNWGPLFSAVVDVQASAGNVRVVKIRAGEYFWDTDPGQGNGNPMVALDGNFGQAVEDIFKSNVPLPTPSGAHTLNIRAQDTLGNWGPLFTTVVDVEASASNVRVVKVRAGEYFWDTDPGQGNANPMVAFDGNFGQAVEAISQSNVALPSPSGAHTLNIRAQDTVGNWGPLFTVVVDVEGINGRVLKVRAGEYFWDTDPGQGNANPMVALDGNFGQAVEGLLKTNAPLPSPAGVHTLNVRAQDTVGNWGPLFTVVVEVDSTISPTRQVIAAECYFDVDPGQGNGTPMLAVGGSFTKIVQGLIGGTLPTPVTAGMHALYIRAKDVAGRWGPVFGVVVNIDTTIGLNAHISGPRTLCASSLAGVSYTTPLDTGANYTWTITGGTILTGTTTDSITVNWNSVGPYLLKVNVCNTTHTQCNADSFVLAVNSPISDTVNKTICQGVTYGGHGANGTYIDTFTAANGCDSIRTLNLTVIPFITDTLNKTICQGQSFEGHGTSGVFVDTLHYVGGCDSIVRHLNLTVTPVATNSVSPIICQGQSYNGHTATGTYSDTILASGGCDSIISTVHLTVLPFTTDTLARSICQGQSFEGHSTSGNFIDTLHYSGGCDSIIRHLNLTVQTLHADTVTRTICQGQSFEGHNTSGTFIDTLHYISGCDSIVRHLNLTVTPVTTNSVSPIICQGQTYNGHTTSGTYTDTLLASGGCDSVISTVHLTVLQFITDTLSHSICQGQSFEGHSTTGNFVDTLHYVGGCDSIIRHLNLTVQSSIRDTVTLTICQGVSYGGHTATGNYLDSFVATGGCDSFRLLNLTVLPITTDALTKTICQGQSFEGHNTNGTFTDTLHYVSGCDSIIRTLHLTVVPVTTNSVSPTICQGQSYNGHTATGNYSDTVLASGGCDSIITTVNLTVLSVTFDTLNKNICQGLSFEGHSTSGTFIDTLHYFGGCDSIIRTLNLVVQVSIRDTINQTICQGASYYGHTTTGIFLDSFVAIGGCDSFRLLNLTVMPVINDTLSQTICQGQSFEGHNSNGTFIDTLLYTGGCDSIIRTLHLTVTPAVNDTITPTICFGQSYNGHTTNGTFVDTLFASGGCDSVIRTIQLTVTPVVKDTAPMILCQGQTYNGHTVNGTYTDTLLASGGCDSLIHTVFLTILPSEFDTINVPVCPGSTYYNHTPPGIYTDTFPGGAPNGCDSVRTAILTIAPVYNDTVKIAICQGDTFQGHTVAGTYLDTLFSVSGCDSIIALELAISPIPNAPTIVQHGDTLISSPATTYQWYQDTTKLIGDTSQILIISANGNYSVVVTSDTLNCTNVSTITTGIRNVQFAPNLSIFPNPTTGVVNIQVSGLVEDEPVTIKVFDEIGQLIIAYKQSTAGGRYDGQIDLGNLAQGLYMVQLQYGNSTASRRIVLAK